MLTTKNLLNQFDAEMANDLMNKTIENENLTRPYTLGILDDIKASSDFVQIATMGSYNGEIMPIVNRGKAPTEDSLPLTKLSEVQLMNYFLEMPFSANTLANVNMKIQAMRNNDATEADIKKFVTGVYADVHRMRLVRLQDRATLQKCQCLSNFDKAGDYGFSVIANNRNDKFTYKVEGLPEEIDGSEVNPANSVVLADVNPVEYLIRKLVENTKGDVDEIWMGDNWMRWFMSWKGWSENNRYKIAQRFTYTPAGTSSEVEAKGATLLHEEIGIKFLHITKEVYESDENLQLHKRKVFNPDSVISLKRDELGSFVYKPMDMLNPDAPSVRLINTNDKLNFYQVFDAKYPEMQSVYRSGGTFLAAIMGIDSIQRMTMKLSA